MKDPNPNFIRTGRSLKILSNALTAYKQQGNTLEDFEEDYGCKIIYCQDGISGIQCMNETTKTMLELKYG